MNNRTNSFLTALATVAALVLAAGCQSESPTLPVEAEFQGITTIDRQIIVCNTGSGLLTPLLPLTLNLTTSSATYQMGSVLLPTVVSFAICDFDTAGNMMRPKVQVFGPSPMTLFSHDVQVSLSLADAGLPAGTPDNATYEVRHMNESTGVWEFHQAGRTAFGRVIYSVLGNGTYGISLSGIITTLDSSWTVSGLVTPLDGGTLNLLHSTLTVPPLAVAVPTMVTFTITDGPPSGLPGALPRVYEFGPEGTVFQTAVTLSLALDDAGTDAGADNVIHLYYYDPSAGTWIRQPNDVLRTNERLIARLNHFSRYAFAR